jgi:hypothetical protein
MSDVRGILVELVTENEKYAGTDDHIYIGVVGDGGGREFPLDVRGFNDFERGKNVKYWLGDVWDGNVLAGAKNPYQSQGGWNDPDKWRIELEDVDQVYVRKGGTRSGGADDAYKMDRVEVTLYGASPISRTFSRSTDIWLANEYGLQVWLPEARG